MEESLLEELLDWAKSLQYDYENQLGCDGSNVTYYSFADSAKDFIDTFINRAEEI